MRHLFVCTLLALLGGSHLHGQNQADFNKPFPPHKVIGNVYYVGSEQFASFLTATPEGHILVNSSFETTVPVIRAAVEKLVPVDVFLGAHGGFYNLTEKYARPDEGGANPFIDPDGFKQYVDRSENTFQGRRDEQKKAAGQ
jgi:hypothetical protein